MKKFNYFLWTLALAISFFFIADVFADDNKIKLETYDDAILWYGSDFPDEFDPSLIKDEATRKDLLKIGLKIFEDEAKKGKIFYQEFLAVYYYEKKDFKKGLYWALACAEQGSSIGMNILAVAYMTGQGVVKDEEEGFKWAFLAEAKGHEETERRLNILRKEHKGFDSEGWIIQCKQKAKDWAKEHPKAFFNPD